MIALYWSMSALDLGDAVHDVALDVLRRVELRLLAEIADCEAGCQAGLAHELVVEPGHDPEQARLAGTVRTDHPDLGARVERDRDVLENGLVGRVVPGELVGRVDEFGGHLGRVAAGRRIAGRPSGHGVGVSVDWETIRSTTDMFVVNVALPTVPEVSIQRGCPAESMR